MSIEFPRAVVWDSSKACHIILHVRRSRGNFLYACLDCEEAYVYPLALLDSTRELLKARDDGQVLVWIEDDV